MNASTPFSASLFSGAILAAVLAVHALAGGAAGSAMQHSANQAMHPLQVFRAEPIVIQGHRLAIVKAERIEVRPVHLAVVKAERMTIVGTRRAQILA